MRCRLARELFSATLDGESTDVERAAVDAHLATCGPCRRHAVDVLSLHRHVRVAPAPAVPDLTARVVARTELPEAPGRIAAGARLLLAASAVLLVVVGLPEVLATGHHDHAAHHLAAFDVAVGLGFGWVAWRPGRALAGFLPVATALVVMCLAVTFVDGRATLNATSHAIAVAGLAAAWLLESPVARSPRPTLRPW
jgi:predicted anti-sigma-YlaC factor YlaD